MEISKWSMHIYCECLSMNILSTIPCHSGFIWNELLSHIFITIYLSLSSIYWISWIIVFNILNLVISKIILHVNSWALVCFLRLSRDFYAHSATFILSRSRIAPMNFQSISTILFLASCIIWSVIVGKWILYAPFHIAQKV